MRTHTALESISTELGRELETRIKRVRIEVTEPAATG
jgi:hypothetical protein